VVGREWAEGMRVAHKVRFSNMEKVASHASRGRNDPGHILDSLIESGLGM